ncbi:uncharacterized protein JN550_011733 [Neoarthrinium moseri]|uniref:uncharacterized protein n=1 Tax=Neoarthrinium moseri TaxID=1658444 RepID=UPI001FDB6D0C|nr:uncharacterized protein JN550_011733 [Neoarthrinium moseri]KAI1860049.1 hypothetical protein JN550_011733 [Neoarthrinium moseri]
MVPKRKKSSMALLQQDLAPRGLRNAPDIDAGYGPRRSGRNRRSTDMGSFPMSQEKENSLVAASPHGRHSVETAINRLQEMEDTLQKGVKRQKIAVQSSKVMDVGTNAESQAFLPEEFKKNKEDFAADSRQPRKPRIQGKTKKKEEADNSAPSEEENEVEQDADCCEKEDASPDDITSLKEEGGRPPPVNSDYLPLPWKGRLGYACLNTYLRVSNPPVFSSRTCRIASIIEHRHPLQDPSQPEHSTKNRPDKEQPPDLVRGQQWVESLGLANARDIVKMLRWNDKYGIKFMRLSSEMFPFASHEEYGYKLAPFASDVLAEAGKVAGELGHRLTTHPGQFTQLGSPRKEVVRNAVRDLEYHDELLSLLRLPEQQNKDAVMILHMGGTFGDKEATLQRFRENYAPLSESVKARLVLENDDVCWSVHDLLPICEELNIPMVLDFHHHNIYFDKDKIREGTKDIMGLYPRIKATWDRKGITQKMHYSEQCSEAITPRQRRKHRPRVMTLPPCADTMDLMIEAKDKEQAVFDLMRNFRLPGWDSFNDVIPYERDDENKPPPKPKATPKKKRKGKKEAEEDDEDADMPDVVEVKPPAEIPPEEVGMGGPNRRVYWPVGMEEWLRPKKREVKPKKPAKKDEEDES